MFSSAARFSLNPIHYRDGSSYFFQLNPVLAAKVGVDLVDVLRKGLEGGCARTRRELTSLLERGVKGFDLDDARQVVDELILRQFLLPLQRTTGGFIAGLLRQHFESVVGRKGDSLSPCSEKRRMSSIFWREQSQLSSILPLLLAALARRRVRFLLSYKSGEGVSAEVRVHRRILKFSEADRGFPHDLIAGGESAKSKDVFNAIARLAGLPVAQQAVAPNIRVGLLRGEEMGFPLVVKPSNGGMGWGVFADIRSQTDLRKVLTLAFRTYSSDPAQKVLIERFHAGNNHRFFVLGNKIIAGYVDSPPTVTGDGRLSIRDLIREENKARKSFPEGDRALIPIDAALKILLGQGGLSLDSIPSKGRRLVVGKVLNLARGASSRPLDVRNLHPSVRRILVKAVQLLGMHWSAVDYVAPTLSKSPEASSGIICEVQPIGAFMNPGLLDLSNIAASVVRYCLTHDLSKPSARIIVRPAR